MFLLDSVTANTTGDPVDVREQDKAEGRDEITLQIAISGTATVNVYGRVSSGLPWVLLGSYTSSQLVPVARVPQMKADATNVGNGASVSVVTYAL